MKKLVFLSLIFFLASSASATVYKWIDEQGVVNFADDSGKVPQDLRDKVVEVSVPKRDPALPLKTPVETVVTRVPPIAQTLIREGDFAVKLVEALKIGRAMSEAEAESMLASAGITPKNGWIADFPVTPVIIGELQSAVGAAADSGKLAMKRDDAIAALHDLTAQQDLPVRADTEGRYAEGEPARDYGEYSRPEVINNYYYNEGPPVMTYYPPPPPYYYMYAWIPSPFWCSGFFFPGFFILHDFHKVIVVHKKVVVVSNHFKDYRTGRISRIDPEKRHGHGPFVRGPHPREAREGARSIPARSRGRVNSETVSLPTRDRGSNGRSVASSRSGGESGKNQVRNREIRRPIVSERPPVIDRRVGRIPVETGFQRTRGEIPSQPAGRNRRDGMSFERSSRGEVRSFNPPSRGEGRTRM